eukprot:3886501-Alexandrium_andersonii.AAC.1
MCIRDSLSGETQCRQSEFEGLGRNPTSATCRPRVPRALRERACQPPQHCHADPGSSRTRT